MPPVGGLGWEGGTFTDTLAVVIESLLMRYTEGDSEGERGRRPFSSIVVAVVFWLQQTQVCAVARLCMRLAQFPIAF